MQKKLLWISKRYGGTHCQQVQRSRKKGLNYNTLIGDDDSATLAKLRAEVNLDIIKISDPTHTCTKHLMGN